MVVDSGPLDPLGSIQAALRARVLVRFAAGLVPTSRSLVPAVRLVFLFMGLRPALLVVRVVVLAMGLRAEVLAAGLLVFFVALAVVVRRVVLRPGVFLTLLARRAAGLDAAVRVGLRVVEVPAVVRDREVVRDLVVLVERVAGLRVVALLRVVEALRVVALRVEALRVVGLLVVLRAVARVVVRLVEPLRVDLEAALVVALRVVLRLVADLVALRAAGLALPVEVRLPATGLPVVRRVRPAVFFFAVFLLLVGMGVLRGPSGERGTIIACVFGAVRSIRADAFVSTDRSEATCHDTQAVPVRPMLTNASAYRRLGVQL